MFSFFLVTKDGGSGKNGTDSENGKLNLVIDTSIAQNNFLMCPMRRLANHDHRCTSTSQP